MAGLLGRGHTLDIVEETAKINAARALPDGTVEAAFDPRGPGETGVMSPGPVDS